MTCVAWVWYLHGLASVDMNLFIRFCVAEIALVFSKIGYILGSLQMYEFRVHVKYVDIIVDMDLIEPGDCSVISLINDAKKELSGCNIEAWETWQLRVTFP
ncbi:hypothetical protein Dsin_017512 [Dipteronia sinensis]|uniref:Uncharacterized protein n=1 Tax=Dipteronia sinensis TaxID=43782 RepID=A0AAE0AFN7_9ROSI|nr:hypothetical protein Dsin_017512 [Dipteronia sinensis]